MPVLDASFGQYLFDLVFYLLLCFLSWKSIRKDKPALLIWFLIAVFCVFSYFAGDWFHYRISFPTIDKNYSEPIYYYFSILAGKNYLIYRLLVWGLATLLVYLTCTQLGLNKNITVFVFVCFFLPIFCYARASLAMASYFCGLSYLVKQPIRPHMISNVFKGIVLIILSYFFHRSFLTIIAVTPFIFLRYNKKTIILIVLLFPLLLAMIRNSLNQFATEVVFEGSELESFADAAQGYASQERRIYNWKYSLVSNLKYVGFYIPFLYMLWITKLSKRRIQLPSSIEKYLSIGTLIIVVSTAFFVLSYTDNTSQVLGYRYLYMSGIPSTILVSYALQSNSINTKKSIYLMFLSWLSTIALIVGKLFALS